MPVDVAKIREQNENLILNEVPLVHIAGVSRMTLEKFRGAECLFYLED
jgi:hypothetical protein